MGVLRLGPISSKQGPEARDCTVGLGLLYLLESAVELVRNLMAHAQKPDFVFPRNGRVHLNR